jgi:DNA-binding NarL/FixJ family response regulator
MLKSTKAIKVLVADDYDLILEGLVGIISQGSALEVIGRAANGEELIKLARRLRPDVIIADIIMPKLDGIEACRRIKNEFPDTPVIALSSFNEEDLIVEMLRAGASGYLLKGAGKAEFIKAIKAVYKNENYFCSGTKKKVTQILARAKSGPVLEGKKLFTERELQVIKLICDGLPSKVIADQLGIKSRTVERYRDAIMQKIEVKNVAAVVKYAVKNNLDS